MSDNDGKIFGIDLGTTYSAIAYVDEYDKPIVVPNAENERVTPSVVFFDNSEIIVGQVAKEYAKTQPDDIVAFIKRSMGDPNFLFVHNNDTFRAEEISAYILKKLVKDAEQNLGVQIKDVVITCPAYFGINEREATKKAGEIANLNVRNIINEPTAAAITYGSIETNENKVVLVYDLGGGTFDTTMIEIKPDSINVICTGGDHNLGGKDWDDRIIAYLVEQFHNETGTNEDILEDPETLQDLILSAEGAKKNLSKRDKAPIRVTHEGEKVSIQLERSKFEELTEDLLERTISLTHEMLSDAKKKGYENFDEILLVGGSSRMPMVSERIKKEFSIEPKLFDPDESVAKGAAIFGRKLSLGDKLVEKISQITNKDAQDINLDTIDENVKSEAMKKVSEDQAIPMFTLQNMINKEIKNVTSKSFGIIALDNQKNEIVVNLVEKNSTVPIDITKQFGTSDDNQDNVLIQIMENEYTDDRILPENASEIGNAKLDLPSGLPEHSPIDVNFKLNEEGRLDITAIELTENRIVNATIETNSVIQGDDFEMAKSRSNKMTVT